MRARSSTARSPSEPGEGEDRADLRGARGADARDPAAAAEEEAHRRERGIMHRRAPRIRPDRARRLQRLLSRRRGGLFERREDHPRRCGAAARPLARRGLISRRRRTRARRARAARRGYRPRYHGHRRARGRDARQAGRAGPRRGRQRSALDRPAVRVDVRSGGESARERRRSVGSPRGGDRVTATRPLGIGLLGLGTVGTAVARTVAERSRHLDEAAGRPLRLVAAAVRDPARARDAGEIPITGDAFAILDDPEIEVVVEVIGGVDPGRDLLLAAFERGKHVVTANKELVAKEWDILHEAARQAKRQLRFEAAVAAAVPVIAAARTLGASRPRTVRGLLNGTSTFICSRMQGGASFDDALAEAQRAGYAEPDPSNDVDGLDAAYKLVILLNILGHRTSPDDVRRTSLRGLAPPAIQTALGRGRTIRSLAVAEIDGKRVSARVAPEEVDLTSLEGGASGPTNVVTFETDLAGTLTFSGPGAGGAATASAILGDVIAIARSR